MIGYQIPLGLLYCRFHVTSCSGRSHGSLVRVICHGGGGGGGGGLLSNSVKYCEQGGGGGIIAM